MIIEGSSKTAEPPEAKRPRLEDRHENAIVFTERDAEGILASHNDAVFVIANIIDFNAHHVFVDNGSSIDILYYSIFTQMRFTPDLLNRFDILIQDFFESSMILEGMIKLLVIVDTPP